MSIRLLLYLMVLAISSPCAGARWLHLKSPNFDVYTDGREARGREILSELERFRSLFASQAAGRNVSPLPVRVFLFQSATGFQPFQTRLSSPGYFHGGSDRDYIAMVDSSTTAVHEYVHVLLRHASREVPLWFGEGMAEFYSTAHFTGRKISIGEPIAAHIQRLKQDQPLDLKMFLAAGENSTYYKDRSTVGLFYAQAWALTHMLQLSESYRAGASRYVSMTLRGEPNALEAAFGRTPGEVEKDLRAYIVRSVFPRADLPLETNGKLETVSAEPLSELDSALLLGDLFAANNKPAEAEKLYRALIKAHPQSAEAEAALGYLALQQREDGAAVRHFRSALELGARSGRLCYDLAMLTRERGNGETDVLELLHRSVELDPALYESHYFLGYLALQSGRHSEAVESLKSAAAIQPNRVQVWEYLALAYRGAGAREDAIDAAAQAVRLATNDAEVLRTQATLETVSGSGSGRAPAKPAPRPSATQAVTRLEGTLTQIDCLGESARLWFETTNGKVFLLVRDPRSVSLKNAGAVTFEFACGPMEPRAAAIEFVPLRNDIYGTDGEIRTMELR